MKKRKSVVITVNGIQPVPIHPIYQDYTTPFMIRNQKWYDELSDPDFFTPSCPHLHSKDGHYKMNVYTGELYDIPIKKISNKFHIQKKDLIKLWNDKKFYLFVAYMRKLFYKNYPNGNLPDIPEYCKLKDDKPTKQRIIGHRNIYVKFKIPISRV